MNDELDIDEQFKCLSCRENTRDEYYMVRNDLWNLVVPGKKGMLCIGCLEDRIGRRLVPNDFTDLPVNRLDFNYKSDRLRDRLGYGG